jgi:streptomycin 3"-adenylyltransferase
VLVTAATAPPSGVVTYGRRLSQRVAERTGHHLVGSYIHGSAALGGWVATRSDVDVLVVVDDKLSAQTLFAVTQALVDGAADSPGTGLECSVVTAASAAEPAPPWPFLVHVQSAPEQPVRVVRGADLAGDPDLLMHYAVCREAGVAVSGPRPGTVFGAVPRTAVLAYLADELSWGLAHGSEAYAVLNACRALVYVAHGRLVSKVSGGSTALEYRLGPSDVITRALAEQLGLSPTAAVAADAAAFVRAAGHTLRAAV